MEEEIRYVQSLLRDISFYDDGVERVIPDGIYGEQTESSVRSFQRNYNLRETGEVDNDTWDRIVEVHRDTIYKNQYELCVKVIDEIALPIERGEASAGLYVIQAMMLALSDFFDNIEPVAVTGMYDKASQDVAERIMIISGIEPKDSLDREFINALTGLYMTYVTKDNIKNSSAQW